MDALAFFSPFQAHDLIDFYRIRDAILRDLSAPIGPSDMRTLADLEGLVRSAYWMGLVNRLSVEDFVSLARVWGQRLRGRGLDPGAGPTFDLFDDSPPAISMALAVTLALRHYRKFERYLRECVQSQENTLSVDEIVKMSDAFVQRIAPAPPLRSILAFPGDQELLQELLLESTPAIEQSVPSGRVSVPRLRPWDIGMLAEIAGERVQRCEYMLTLDAEARQTAASDAVIQEMYPGGHVPEVLLTDEVAKHYRRARQEKRLPRAGTAPISESIARAYGISGER